MIKLTKININPENKEITHAESVEEYRIDQERGTWGEFFDGKSPPIDYWILGELMRPPQVGRGLLIDRTNRNGVEVRGVMMTSAVKKIDKEDGVTYITTANSLYKLEES